MRANFNFASGRPVHPMGESILTHGQDVHATAILFRAPRGLTFIPLSAFALPIFLHA